MPNTPMGNLPGEKKRINTNLNKSRQSKNVLYFLILLLTFCLYGNTLRNDYALDDAVVLNSNKFTQKGIQGIRDILQYDTFTGFYGKSADLGGGRYRPLSLVSFALEHEFFGDNPTISHLVNIILYGITGILIFIICCDLFPVYKNEISPYLSLPFLVSIIFIAHPIHTEVVANIKGRDEILSLLASLFTLWFSLKFLRKGNWKFLGLIFICFFLALLSKENSITYITVIPITIYFFKKSNSKNNLFLLSGLILSTFLFFILRSQIIHTNLSNENADLMNNPFVDLNFSEKYATIFYTMGFYIRLLLFPHPLTYDYYPYYIPVVNWLNPMALISLVIYFNLIVIAIGSFKRKTIFSYCIIYFILTISIVSNLFFTVGVPMAERFAYMPSLAFCIFIAFIFKRFLYPETTPSGALEEMSEKNKNNIQRLPIKGTWKNKVSLAILLMLLLSYSVKTICRNQDWKNDLTLCEADVKTSYTSAKSNKDLGKILFDQGIKLHDKSKKNANLQRSIQYLNKAVEIYPDYIEALDALGSAHYILNKNVDTTLYFNKRILKINPGHNGAYDNIKTLMEISTDIDYKITVYQDLYKINPNRFDTNYALGIFFKEKKDYKQAVFYFNKAATLRTK